MTDAWIVGVVRTPRGRGRPDGGLDGLAGTGTRAGTDAAGAAIVERV
jgi:hypothetical protein